MEHIATNRWRCYQKTRFIKQCLLNSSHLVSSAAVLDHKHSSAGNTSRHHASLGERSRSLTLVRPAECLSFPQKTHTRSGRWGGKVTTQNKWKAQQWKSCAWQLARHSRTLLLGHLGCHRMRKGKAASGEFRWREKIWAVFLLIRRDVLEAVLVRILQIRPLRNS